VESKVIYLETVLQEVVRLAAKVIFSIMLYYCVFVSPSPPLDNIRVMVIVWRLRGNIIRTAPCWVV